MTEANDTDVVFMTAENADTVLAPRLKPFIFPRDSDDAPREGFYCRHATCDKIRAYQRAAKGGSDAIVLKALTELMADTITDPGGTPIYGADALLRLGKARIDRFLFMQTAVSLHNGLDDDGKKIKQMIEDAEKNS